MENSGEDWLKYNQGYIDELIKTGKAMKNLSPENQKFMDDALNQAKSAKKSLRDIAPEVAEVGDFLKEFQDKFN